MSAKQIKVPKRKRWFASKYVLRISLQNEGDQEKRGYGRFFDTWREAHDYAMKCEWDAPSSWDGNDD